MGKKNQLFWITILNQINAWYNIILFVSSLKVNLSHFNGAICISTIYLNSIEIFFLMISINNIRGKRSCQNINNIGKILINNKKRNFLSLRLILNFIFFINNLIKKKKGISITICLSKKIKGNWICLKNPISSKPVLFKP